jgi:glutamate-1-semialdehyde 2,1-aminomutase
MGAPQTPSAAAPPDRASYVAARQRSAQLFERASQAFVAGVNHNLRYTPPATLFFARGEGPAKWDVDGNEYVDYSMASAALLLGHRPLQVDAAELVGIPAASHENEIEWAELVKSLVPSAEKVRFVASGTESTLLALRLARASTGRPKIVRFHRHYHGWHDSVMFGLRPPFDAPASAGVPGELAGTMCAVDERVFADVEALVAAGDVAAVIVEPSGASYGTVPLVDGLLPRLRDLTQRHGTLLIFDEMITGFRVAPGGVQEREGVIPDLTTLGKILTGGFPGGAVVGADAVLEALHPRTQQTGNHAMHWGTFNGHPVTAAVGKQTLQEVATGKPGAAAEAHAVALRAGLAELVESLGIHGTVYGESSWFHLYLAGPGQEMPEGVPSPELLTSMAPALVEALHLESRRRGIDLMSYNGGVASAAHGARELDIALGAFEGVLRTLRDTGLVASS